MGRRKQKTSSHFVLFDVVYEDGTRSSNRRVPADALVGPDGDDAAREMNRSGNTGGCFV